MKAYELLAKLRYLVLAGFKDGEFFWIGSSQAWNLISQEEENILRDHEIAKI